MDQIITDSFIATPKINVEQNALDLGFNKRIEFPEQNIVKYFKIINDTEKEDFWYFSRKCAKENGVLQCRRILQWLRYNSIQSKFLLLENFWLLSVTYVTLNLMSKIAWTYLTKPLTEFDPSYFLTFFSTF